MARVDLVDVATEEEAVALVAERASQVPEGTWIVGAGWDEGAWADRYPDMELLTERVPNHPVYMRSLHSFAGWGNRMAFELAGITGETEAPVGGEIRKDAQGQPTGLLLNRAVPLLEEAIPTVTHEQLKERVLDGLEEMARSGFVAVHEAGRWADLTVMDIDPFSLESEDPGWYARGHDPAEQGPGARPRLVLHADPHGGRDRSRLQPVGCVRVLQ